MKELMYIFNLLQVILFALLLVNILYLFIFAIASLFRLRVVCPKNESQKKIAVLIPGYKEDKVIIDVARDALGQNYPRDKYEVIVIADSFADATIATLKQLPIKLVEVSFENSTKAKALNKAMSVLPDEYDIAVVLDADNIMAPDFLSQIDDFFAANSRTVAVQGHRTAKNMNTPFAILDAISEEITNQLFRKGQRILGFSAAIIGSGVAFDYAFFKNVMLQIEAIGGYDKELEMRLLRNRHKVYYLPDAYVYDEKVQTAGAFANQRRRWLSSQFHYVRLTLGEAVKMLLTTGNLDYFNKVFQWTLLPRIIILGIVCVMIPMCIIIEQYFFGTYLTPAWIILGGVCLLSFIMLVPGKFYTIRTLKATVKIPLGLWLMFKNFFALKGANRSFIHTEHGVEADDSFEKKK